MFEIPGYIAMIIAHNDNWCHRNKCQRNTKGRDEEEKKEKKKNNVISQVKMKMQEMYREELMKERQEARNSVTSICRAVPWVKEASGKHSERNIEVLSLKLLTNEL